jgi:hypothetical protein
MSMVSALLLLCLCLWLNLALAQVSILQMRLVVQVSKGFSCVGYNFIQILHKIQLSRNLSFWISYLWSSLGINWSVMHRHHENAALLLGSFVMARDLLAMTNFPCILLHNINSYNPCMSNLLQNNHWQSPMKLQNVKFFNNPAGFLDPHHFYVTFECIVPLKDSQYNVYVWCCTARACELLLMLLFKHGCADMF